MQAARVVRAVATHLGLDLLLVLDRLHTGHLAGHLRGARARGETRRLAGQRHHARVRPGGDLLQTGLLRQPLLDPRRDVLVADVNRPALLGLHDLEVDLHAFDVINALDDFARGRLGIVRVDLAPQRDHTLHRLHRDLAALDTAVTEERD